MKELSKEDLKIEHPRKTYYLNPRLVKARKVWDKVPQLILLHKHKLDMFDLMDKEDDIKDLRCLARIVTGIEYKLQGLWGFPRDEKYHEWYLVPRCTCPVLDNMDSRGTNYTVVDVQCLIHGKELDE